MDCLYIVIPAYNEEETIGQILEEWYTVIENHNGDGKSRILVINDGSKDGTEQSLEAFKKDHPLMTYVTKTNAGHGAAIYDGYRLALSKGADYVFQTDSDGQTLPGEFEAFWKHRKMYDLIIGSRRGRQDGKDRVFVTKVLKLTLLAAFHVVVEDANTPYRLMNAETLSKNLKRIPAHHNLTNVLLSVVYHKRKQKIRYISITFRPRQGGVNSINMKKIIKIGKNAVKDFFVFSRNLR